MELQNMPDDGGFPAGAEHNFPNEFFEMLDANPGAKERFMKLSDSHKKEYAVWISEAKKEETRMCRIEKAIIMLSDEGAQPE